MQKVEVLGTIKECLKMKPIKEKMKLWKAKKKFNVDDRILKDLRTFMN